MSCQRYIVTPRQNLHQCFLSGRSAVLFSAKHPDRVAQQFAAHGAARWKVRYLLRPLARIPGIPAVLCAIASMLAQHAYGRWAFLDRLVIQVFEKTRELSYWAGVASAHQTARRG